MSTILAHSHPLQEEGCAIFDVTNASCSVYVSVHPDPHTIPFQPRNNWGAGIVLSVPQMSKLRPSSDKDFTPRPQELTQGCPSLSIPCPGSHSPGLVLKLALGRVHPGSWQPPLHSLASSLGYSPKLSATIHLSLLFLLQMTHKMK